MKKRKVVLIIILIAGIATIALCTAKETRTGSEYIIPNKTIEYHTKEELTDLYWQNKDLLISVKNSILSNKAFLQVLIDQKDGDAGVLTDYHKDCFTEAEWADIVTVFEELHPYMLMMERKGRPLIFYIAFGSQKEDSVTKRTYLYWFPNEEEREHHEEPGVFPYGVFTQVDEGWYIVEATRSR